MNERQDFPLPSPSVHNCEFSGHWAISGGRKLCSAPKTCSSIFNPIKLADYAANEYKKWAIKTSQRELTQNSFYVGMGNSKSFTLSVHCRSLKSAQAFSNVTHKTFAPLFSYPCEKELLYNRVNAFLLKMKVGWKNPSYVVSKTILNPFGIYKYIAPSNSM